MSDQSIRDLHRFAAERIMQFGKDVDHGVFDDSHAIARRVVSIAEEIVDEVQRRMRQQ